MFSCRVPGKVDGASPMMKTENHQKPSQPAPTRKSSVNLMTPERVAAALEQCLKDHPKLTREKAISMFKESGAL